LIGGGGCNSVARKVARRGHIDPETWEVPMQGKVWIVKFVAILSLSEVVDWLEFLGQGLEVGKVKIWSGCVTK
jgi:hypothetical protein